MSGVRWAIVVALGGAAALLAATPANAATRFAEPNGNGASGAGQCVEADPCSLQTAVEDPSVVNGDEVILLPGTTNGVYESQTDTVTIDNAVTVRSRETDPRPVIPISGGGNFGFYITNGGATLRRLQINGDATAGAALQMISGGTAERLYVQTVGLNVSPCVFGFPNPVLRDSVCYATNGGDAVVFSIGGAITATSTLRNVTAVTTDAAASAIHVFAGEATPGGGGANLTLNAANVIASGANFDVQAETDSSSGAVATINLTNSNYDQRSTLGSGTSVTDPTTNSNQTAPPVFVNAATGNFHQTAASPTIDMGDPGASMLGTLDIDGDPRSLPGDCDSSAAPDIGADEFTPPCRFAEPNGDGPSGAGQCLEADPCSLQAAIEDLSVANGDEVILLPGATNGVFENQTDALTVDNAITVRSRGTDPVPVIPTTAGFGVFVVNGGATLRRLQIESNANGGSALRFSDGGTAERVFVQYDGTGGDALVLAGSSLVRDSVFWNSSATGQAAVNFSVIGSVTQTATLRNVTAIAPLDAIHVEAGSDADLTVDAANVIANATTDVTATTDGAANTTATATLSNSNYDTRSALGTGASVTDPSTNSNQMAAAVFVDAANGDFHQTAESPTIDMGDPGASMLGTLDLDGEVRSFDGDCNSTATPDIGADEFTGSCPPPPGPTPQPEPGTGDTTPPETTITAGPKSKTKSKTASFSFTSTEPGSTFECKLDDGAFQPCTSPRGVKVKRGKHSFQVRAKDAAGNVDPTPAEQSWKVKKKKKKKK